MCRSGFDEELCKPLSFTEHDHCLVCYWFINHTRLTDSCFFDKRLQDDFNIEITVTKGVCKL